MNAKQILQELDACNEAIGWAGDRTIEQAWAECPRGDWMLWFAAKQGVDKRTLTLAKALCAKTVIHLMRDERSRNAVAVTERYGRGEATDAELSSAALAAEAEAEAAAWAAEAAARAAAAEAWAAAWAAEAAAWAAAAEAWAAAWAAEAAALAALAWAAAAEAEAAEAARQKTRLETANICREVLTGAVFSMIDEARIKCGS